MMYEYRNKIEEEMEKEEQRKQTTLNKGKRIGIEVSFKIIIITLYILIGISIRIGATVMLNAELIMTVLLTGAMQYISNHFLDKENKTTINQDIYGLVGVLTLILLLIV